MYPKYCIASVFSGILDLGDSCDGRFWIVGLRNIPRQYDASQACSGYVRIRKAAPVATLGPYI
jgi:hypothetical protein